MEHAIRELCDALKRSGYIVDVYHRHNSAPHWVANPSNKWQSYAADFLLSWYLGRKIVSGGRDNLVAVISNGPLGWYMPTLQPSVKRIHFYHGTYRGGAHALAQSVSRAGALKLKWWDSMFLERFSGRGKQVLCNSEQTRNEVLKFFGYSGCTVWLPLDIAHFAPRSKSSARQRFGLAATDKVGVFVGSAQPIKGFHVVRHLMDTLPQVRWLLALRGDPPNDLYQKTNVLLLRDAAPSLLPDIYNAADFAVCSSLYESFGYVVAEALACGTPVIASLGGASRILLDTPMFKPFLIDDAASVEPYLKAITTVLTSPDIFRQSVIDCIRPKVVQLMARENWLRRFLDLSGL